MSNKIKLLEKVNLLNMFTSKTYFTVISLCSKDTQDLVEFSIKMSFNRSTRNPSDASAAADQVRAAINIKGKLVNFEENMIAVRFFEKSPVVGKSVDGYAVKKCGVMAEISQFKAKVSREKLDSLKPMSI